MRLLVALATGLAVGGAVGAILGLFPRRVPKRRKARSSRFQTWLIQSGVELTPRQFRLASLGVGLAAFMVLFLASGAVTVAIVPAIAVGMAPWAYFSRVRVGRLAEVQRAWPDGLRDIVGSILAGHSLARSVELLAAGGPPPLQTAFARFPVLSRSLGVVPALEVIKEELADPVSDRVIEVLILAHDRGGNIIGEILADLAATTSSDAWAVEEIRTLALEQKINARIVFVLPWLVLVALTAQNEAFRAFYQSSAGVVVVVIGAVLSAIGLGLANFLAKDQPEPRVFGASAGRAAP